MQYPKTVPVIDVTKCINCEECIIVCPTNAICKQSNYSCSRCIKYCLSLEVPCNPDHYVFCYEQCNACGLCVTICPIDAINWSEIHRLRKIIKNG